MKQRVKELWQPLFHKLFSRILPRIAYFLISAILKTCRIKILGLEGYLDSVAKGKGILMLWHNRLLLGPYFGNCVTPQVPYAAVISNSHDAAPLADLTDSFSNSQALRVPHDSRAQALKAIVNTLKTGKIAVITPDGPTGPRYEVKPGIAFAARATASKIHPFTWTANRFWCLKSWDKMRIPQPFSKIVIAIGAPIEISRKDKCRHEEEVALLGKALHQLDKKSSAFVNP